MAEYLIQDTTLDAIADAINAKTGGSAAMNPAEMVTEIGSISGGGNIVESSGSFTLSSQTTDYEILHGLERTPFLAMVWANENVYVSGRHVLGGYTALLQADTLETSIPLGGTYGLIKLGFYSESGGYTQAPLVETTSTGNYVKNFSSASFHLTSSAAYPIPAGIEFKWRAFAMVG